MSQGTKHDHLCDLCRVELVGVSVHSGKQTLLDDLHFHIHCGEITALLGRNGAGKTTLLKALIGEIPYEGKIGHVRYTGETQSAKVGYVPQHLDVDTNAPVTVMDFMASALCRFPICLGVPSAIKKRVLAMLTEQDCAYVANRRMGALSGGEMQRVLLSLSLMPMPELLLLDEPVSGMDALGEEHFYQTVSELREKHHLAILLVSHDFEMVRKYADRALLIDHKLLMQGTPQDVFASVEFANAFSIGVKGGHGA